MLVQNHHRRSGGTALAGHPPPVLRMSFRQAPPHRRQAIGPSLSTPSRIDSSCEAALTIGRAGEHNQTARLVGEHLPPDPTPDELRLPLDDLDFLLLDLAVDFPISLDWFSLADVGS